MRARVSIRSGDRAAFRIGSWTKRPDEKQARGPWSRTSIAAIQYQWTYSFGSRCRVEDDARWQTESREGTISARDIRSRGAYTNFEWVRNRVGTAGQPPWRPIEMEFDRASLPFAPFPPFTPRLSPFIHLPIRRTAAAAIKRQRQVPEWRSAADAQCDPPPRVQSKRARQQSGTFDEARAFYLRLFIYLFALRIFAIPLEHVVSNEICPRNFFVVGSSLEGGAGTVIGELHSFHLQRIKLRKISLLVLLWREACNYSANFVAGKFIRLGVYATLLWDNFLLEFDNKVSNFSLGKFSLSRNIDIWLDVAAFFASLTRWNLRFGLNFFFL